MKYNTCPYCGDHLDFGERCDCQNRGQEPERREAGKDGEELVGDKPAEAGGKLPRIKYSAVGA